MSTTSDRRRHDHRDPWTPTPGAAVRQAATVVVLRRSDAGMQVLLMRRAPRDGDIHSGASVFPGGLLDAADAEGSALCSGLDDAQASARLGLPSGGLAYWFAAMRECFEEAGLLYAAAQDRSHLDAAQLAQIAAQRDALNRRELTMAQICQRFGIHLAAERITYLAHWLTPPGVPKRYDTRFFVTEAPELQVASQDDHETDDAAVADARPKALARRKELKLAPPTWKILELLQRLGDVDAVLAHARALGNVPCIMPRLATGSKGLRPVMPDEPAYAEIGRIDPEGQGHASYELAPAMRGAAVAAADPRHRRQRQHHDRAGHQLLPDRRRRLRNEWAALDPGPLERRACAGHRRCGAGPDPLDLRHAHAQGPFAGGAGVEGAHRRGAARHGRAARRMAGHRFRARRAAAPAASVFELPGDSTLRVVHTPGHAGNHLCYLLDEERMLFTGDHVMQGSTVVINPPDGDMGAYLRSLRELMELELDWLAPGHGFLMPQPRQAMQQIVDHRLKREAKVLRAFARRRHAVDGRTAGRGLRRRAAEAARDGAALAAGASAEAARRRADRGDRQRHLEEVTVAGKGSPAPSTAPRPTHKHLILRTPTRIRRACASELPAGRCDPRRSRNTCRSSR